MLNRRVFVSGVTFVGLSQFSVKGNALLPLLFRFVAGVAFRATAQTVGRTMVQRAVMMPVRGATGAVRSISVVTTRELGVKISGVVAISLRAALLIEAGGCVGVVVQGRDKDASVGIDAPLDRSLNLVVDIVNVTNNKIERSYPLYAGVGKFKFDFELPWEGGTAVKRLDGKSKDGEVSPFTSGNILFATTEDVVYDG